MVMMVRMAMMTMVMMTMMVVMMSGRWFSKRQLRTGLTLKTPYALSFALGPGRIRQRGCLRFIF